MRPSLDTKRDQFEPYRLSVTMSADRADNIQLRRHSGKCSERKWMLLFLIIVYVVLICAPVAVTAEAAQSRPASVPSSAPRLYDSQKLIKMLLRQYPHVINVRSAQNAPTSRQDDNSNNIFTSLNAFIQSRQRNASDITTDIHFKYYNK